jgi:RNA polymerase sigma-70 factor (ECF subfamily)
MEDAFKTVREPDSEETLLSRAQQGDSAAFEALVERHRDAVFGLAYRMTRSEADAAEITQDTFLSAYQNIREFRGESAFGSWVHRIAANNALMRLRHRRVVESARDEWGQEAGGEGGTMVQFPPSDWSRRADEKALDAELGAAIERATDRLPQAYREVFLLKDVEGLSYEQIAEMLGDSVAAIKSRLHRARLALREAIDRFYDEKK